MIVLKGGRGRWEEDIITIGFKQELSKGEYDEKILDHFRFCMVDTGRRHGTGNQ